jgi:hypothetical protein
MHLMVLMVVMVVMVVMMCLFKDQNLGQKFGIIGLFRFVS